MPSSLKLLLFTLVALPTMVAQTTQGDSPLSKITFYREKSEGNVAVKTASRSLKKNSEWVPGSYVWRLFVDGQEFAKLSPDTFVTFELAAGKHEIRTKYSDYSDRLQLDLRPNERVYLRPGWYVRFYSLRMRPQENLKIVSCNDAVVQVKDLPPRPLKTKKIRSGDRSNEMEFPVTCGTQSEQASLSHRH